MKMSNDEYSEHGCERCPFCHGNDVLIGRPRIIGEHHAESKARCLECTRQYFIHFKVDSYSEWIRG